MLYLQRVVEPKVLPNLQIIEENKEIIYEYIQNGDLIKTNIYFEEDTKKIKEKLKKLNNDKENTDSVTSLLIKFFEYYGYNYDFYEQKINISRDNVPIYKHKTDNIAFSIDDPFDAFHNPGKSMAINSPQFNKFVTAIKKEINFIMNGEYLKRLDKLLNVPLGNISIQANLGNLSGNGILNTNANTNTITNTDANNILNPITIPNSNPINNNYINLISKKNPNMNMNPSLVNNITNINKNEQAAFMNKNNNFINNFNSGGQIFNKNNNNINNNIISN